MANIRTSRRGSLQFWPRKRSRHSLARVRSWKIESKAKPLAFIGYKAGMTHLLVTDNRSKSLTKGEKIMVPSTVLDCPPMTVAGISFYKHTKKIAGIFAPVLAKTLGKKIPLPKTPGKSIESITDFDDLRLLVHSNPAQTPVGTKKPKLQEITVGGTREEKLSYAKEVLGKEISINEIFEKGNHVDVHGITKGKGFQGTVKRYGVPIRQHKAEKTKRGIGTLGSWTPKRVQFTVAQPGKMGYHQRTEYNKQIILVGDNGSAVTPRGGFTHYGPVRNHYLLLRGSVVGPQKRAVIITPAIRPDPRAVKEAPEVAYIST